jgi:hypothetical protein
MDSLSQLKRRFSAMPWVLRGFVAASLGIGVAFTLLPLIPGASFQLGERELSSQELWQTRVALALFVVGPLMLVLGLAVLFRQGWARVALVVLPVLQLLPFLAVHWAFGAPSPVSSVSLFLASCAVWAVVAAVYLFGSSASRQHFSNAV